MLKVAPLDLFFNTKKPAIAAGFFVLSGCGGRICTGAVPIPIFTQVPFFLVHDSVQFQFRHFCHQCEDAADKVYFLRYSPEQVPQFYSKETNHESGNCTACPQ